MKTAKDEAYSYIRFSHPDQSKGDSLRRQSELRDTWLTRNKVSLNTSLTLEDKGVSGFTGDHRNNPDRHALAAFVALVKKGRIAKGSYLIVESLDRLSREDIIPALSLLLDLIQSGIRVVQLLPVETVYDAQSNPMHLMMAIMELSRGHSESAMKSERVGRAWKDKKRRAAENGEPLTARTPSWLRLVDGEWEVDEQAAETIRRIYQLAITGYGLGVITKKLNAEKVPIVGRGEHWARSYVAKILNNRAVMGEYQPYKGRASKREKDGKPIPNYYPAVVTEQQWYAARAALSARRGKVGRLSKERVNVFNGLLHDARDGGTIQLVNKGKKGGGRLLVSYKAVQGVEGSQMASFPEGIFDRAVLFCLHEIDPREILPDQKKEDKALVLSGRLAEVEAEIEKLKNRLHSRYSDAVADVLERHADEQKELIDQLKTANEEKASPLGEAWGECQTLLEALETAPDLEEARVRLRAILRRIVDAIWLLSVPRGRDRLCAVQIWFAGRERHRDYLIFHRPGTGGSVGIRPAKSRVCSLSSVGPARVDFRKPTDARKLESLLAAVDMETLFGAMRELPSLHAKPSKS
jgi:DNA invertase Pin-like site-specific DNA recombinase